MFLYRVDPPQAAHPQKYEKSHVSSVFFMSSIAPIRLKKYDGEEPIKNIMTQNLVFMEYAAYGGLLHRCQD